MRPDGTAARAGYDRCGRRTTIVDPAGGVTRIEYTPAGRVRRVTISPGGRVTGYEYDAAGRLSARIDGGGARVEFGYDDDGALLSRTLPAGVTETFGYDPGGRLIGHELPGRGRDALRATTRPGGWSTVTDATGGVRRFAYDPAGRLVEAVDPLGGRTRYGVPRARLAHLDHRSRWARPPPGRTTRSGGRCRRPIRWAGSPRSSYDAAGRLVVPGGRCRAADPLDVRRVRPGRLDRRRR